MTIKAGDFVQKSIKDEHEMDLIEFFSSIIKGSPRDQIRDLCTATEELGKTHYDLEGDVYVHWRGLSVLRQVLSALSNDADYDEAEYAKMQEIVKRWCDDTEAFVANIRKKHEAMALLIERMERP